MTGGHTTNDHAIDIHLVQQRSDERLVDDLANVIEKWPVHSSSSVTVRAKSAPVERGG
jgi:hypothetical protein